MPWENRSELEPMKRPIRTSDAVSSSAKSSGTTKLSSALATPLNGLSPAALRQLERVVKNPPTASFPSKTSTHHFQVISTLEEAHLVQTGSRSIAVAAGSLRDEAELLRLRPIVEWIASLERDPYIMVTSVDADRVLRTAAASSLRRAMEQLGAVFFERPADADSPEALAEFLDREYTPDEAAIAAALAPLPPIKRLKNHDITPYLQPRPGDFAGDQYFLSHLPVQKKP